METYGIYIVAALAAAYLYKSGKLDAVLEKFQGSSASDIPPLPKQPDTTSGRPILDWMADVVLKTKGKDPEVYQAVKNEVAAIKGLK